MDKRVQKSYFQECAVAMALDHVGDRWTLLVIRELLAGPARFSDLARGLTGVAPNLLSNRLKRLTESGIVESKTVFGTSAYALTELGQGLRPAVAALGLWGAAAGPLPSTHPAPIPHARSAAFGLETVLSLAEAPAHRTRIQINADEDALIVEVGGSEPVTVRAALEEKVDATVAIRLAALSALPRQGLQRGQVQAASPSRADKQAAALLSDMVTKTLQHSAAAPEAPH